MNYDNQYTGASKQLSVKKKTKKRNKETFGLRKKHNIYESK